jgi:hypothetical protein
MFEQVIDTIMLQYHSLYEQNREKISAEEEFDKSKERKQMNELVAAIVILYQNRGKSY